MLTFEQLKSQMHALSPVVQTIDDEHITALYRFLRERISCPECFVVMLGETSSGKTSIINGLIKKTVLPVSASPTTANVIEIMDDSDLAEPKYYVINRNATIEEITAHTFSGLCGKSEKQYSRLRLIIPTFPHDLSGLRLFDTPGYGSLLAEHDEVLKEFIPNSDIILYIVSYRVGFQESDHEFLNYIGELVDESTEFVLAINRVPDQVGSADRRIQEIIEHAGDCLHKNLSCYLIKSVSVNEQGEKSFVESDVLWEHVSRCLATDERQQALRRAFVRYQYDFAVILRKSLEKELLRHNTTHEEQEAFIEVVAKLSCEEVKIHKLIQDAFGKISNNIDKLFINAAKKIYEDIVNEISLAGKWTQQQECASFVQHHLLPLQVRIQGREIVAYLQIELNELDENIDSMLNGALNEFDLNVKLKAPKYAPLVFKAGTKIGNHVVDSGLQSFFTKFGGAGGAGAGVANAAKKGLKKAGALVGKKFSRETHNALAMFLKKVGATSTRALTVAATVLVEFLSFIYEANVWKGELAKDIDKALQKWVADAADGVRKDLNELRDHNIKIVSGLIKERTAYSNDAGDSEPVLSINQIQILLDQVAVISDKLEKEMEE